MSEILPVTKECRCLCELGRAGDVDRASVIDIQDCREGERGPPSLLYPDIKSTPGLLYYPLSIFLRIQNPDLGVIEFRTV